MKNADFPAERHMTKGRSGAPADYDRQTGCGQLAQAFRAMRRGGLNGVTLWRVASYVADFAETG